mgnify:CR=1 FL=1
MGAPALLEAVVLALVEAARAAGIAARIVPLYAPIAERWLQVTLDPAVMPAGFAPGTAPTAAIIVIPEIFGLNAGIRQKCDSWAAKGYLAVALDIFWRFAPGVELNPDVEAELNEAFGYFQQYDADKGVLDIETVIKAIRHSLAGHAPVAKVGCVGFCLGGRLAYMAAARTDIDASVGYYGVMIDQMLGESHAIAHPLMLHIPTADYFIAEYSDSEREIQSLDSDLSYICHRR